MKKNKKKKKMKKIYILVERTWRTSRKLSKTSWERLKYTRLEKFAVQYRLMMAF
jgi:hypothetical protein